MKTTKISAIFVLTLTMLALPESAGAEPIGTAFTYQGHIYDANHPANGAYNLKFSLFDSPANGNQTGPDVNEPNVTVTDGYFSVELDFGNVFSDESRWLEISIRPGDSNDTFTTLAPRQKLTATPYAVKSLNGVPTGFMILGSTKDAPQGFSTCGITTSAGGNDDWQTKTPMPTARKYAAAAEVNGKIYVIGGWYDMSNYFLTTVEEYDPDTNTWTTKTPLPDGRRFHTAAAAGGKIYVFGGQNSSYGTVGTTYEYDPEADSWTSKASMPTARKYPASAVADGKIYVIGGNNSSGSSVASNEMYNPQTNSWIVLADMPTARQELGAAAIEGKIYAIGGFSAKTNNEEYDPQTNSWSTKTAMPTGREGLAAVTVVNKIYAIGGRISSSRTNVNETYNPAKDSWSTSTPMTTSRSNAACSVAGGRVYVIGGDTGGITAAATNEQFSPRIELIVFTKD